MTRPHGAGIFVIARTIDLELSGERSCLGIGCSLTSIGNHGWIVAVAANGVKILRPEDEHVLDNVADGVFDKPVEGALRSQFVRDPRHHLSVAIDDGVVVGFASAVHYVHLDKPPQLWINEVGVSPKHQRRGVAKGVLAALLSLGRELGCTEAWVLTGEQNAAARALYQSAGGVETRQIMVSMPLGS